MKGLRFDGGGVGELVVERRFQELVEAMKWFLPPVSCGFMLVNMPFPQYNY